MAEVGIVGMPGPVALTLSGGVNSEGTPIQAATLYAQLTVGDMAKNKLGVVHWPSGTPIHAHCLFPIAHNVCCMYGKLAVCPSSDCFHF